MWLAALNLRHSRGPCWSILLATSLGQCPHYSSRVLHLQYFQAAVSAPNASLRDPKVSDYLRVPGVFLWCAGIPAILLLWSAAEYATHIGTLKANNFYTSLFLLLLYHCTVGYLTAEGVAGNLLRRRQRSDRGLNNIMLVFEVGFLLSCIIMAVSFFQPFALIPTEEPYCPCKNCAPLTYYSVAEGCFCTLLPLCRLFILSLALFAHLNPRVAVFCEYFA